MHSIALLWPAEWEVISRMFLVDQVISICRIHDKTQDNGIVQYQTHPGEQNRQPSARSFSNRHCVSCENVCCVLLDLCRECREGFIFQQQRDMREYAQATVYVRKVIDKKRVSFCMIDLTLSTMSVSTSRNNSSGLFVTDD